MPFWAFDFLSPPFTIYQASILYEKKAAEGMEWDLCILNLLISGHDQLLMVFIIGLHNIL